MISELDLVARARPAASRPQRAPAGRPSRGRSARSCSSPSSRSIPAGLVPTGPLRWTAITVTTGLALALLVRRPVGDAAADHGVWVALIGVLLLAATIRRRRPVERVDRHPRPAARLPGVAHVPGAVPRGPRVHDASRDTRSCCAAGTLGASVLGVWSAAEVAGHSPLGLTFADARAGGPFGQPAYLGAACLLFGPLAHRGRARPRARRAAGDARGALGAAGALFALAASQTRAAWVGAVVAAGVARGRASARRSAAHRAGSPSPSCVVVRRRSRSAWPRRSARARVSTFDLHRGTSASRFGEWRIATRTIADHPLLGVGPEGYRVVFPQEVDAAYVRDYGNAVYPDRAHNGDPRRHARRRPARRRALPRVARAGATPRVARDARARSARDRARRGGARVRRAAAVPVPARRARPDLLGPRRHARRAHARAPGRVMTVRARWLVVPIAIATVAALVLRRARRARRSGDEARRDHGRLPHRAPRRRRGDPAAPRLDPYVVRRRARRATRRRAHRRRRRARSCAAGSRPIAARSRRCATSTESCSWSARARSGSVRRHRARAPRSWPGWCAGAPHDPMLRKDQVTAQSSPRDRKTVNPRGRLRGVSQRCDPNSQSTIRPWRSLRPDRPPLPSRRRTPDDDRPHRRPHRSRTATSRPSTATATPTSRVPSPSRSATSTSRRKRPTRRWSARTPAGTRSAPTTTPAAGCTESASTGPVRLAAASPASFRSTSGASSTRRRPTPRTTRRCETSTSASARSSCAGCSSTGRSKRPPPRCASSPARSRAVCTAPSPNSNETSEKPVNSNQLDQLRDALRRETRNIHPVGLGAAVVQRRGRRRRNRGRAVVAVGAATCVAGLGVDDHATRERGSAQRRRRRAAGAPRSRRRSSSVPSPAPSRTRSAHFTTAAGVTYELSTAPGAVATNVQPDQAIYSTTDGEHWTSGRPEQVVDLRRSPSTTACSTPSAPHPVQLPVTFATASARPTTAASAWSDTALPFDLTAPSANVPLTRSSNVQLASDATATVALLSEQFSPNLDAHRRGTRPGTGPTCPRR